VVEFIKVTMNNGIIFCVPNNLKQRSYRIFSRSNLSCCISCGIFPIPLHFRERPIIISSHQPHLAVQETNRNKKDRPLYFLHLFASLSFISLNASSPGANNTGTAAVKIANTPRPAAKPSPPGAATAPYTYSSSA